MNRNQDIYFMTRYGFSLLEMEFTGERALDFIFDFIEAFSESEAAAKKQMIIPKTYAETNNLTIHTLRYWLYKRKRSGKTSGGFIEIKEFSLGQKFVIRYPNGVELKISSNTSVLVIRSLVNL